MALTEIHPSDVAVRLPEGRKLALIDRSDWMPHRDAGSLGSARGQGAAMVRRKAAPWAATSLPEIRRQWCNALETTIAHQATAVDEPPVTSDAAGATRMRRLTSSLAEALDAMRREVEMIREADLFWVSRSMVDVAVDASTSLPEWTPAATLPAASGIMCWAKPAGAIPFAGMGATADAEVSWDGVFWFTRDDGVLQMQPVSRLARNPELLHPFKVSSPLWAAFSTLVLNPLAPRTEEVAHSPDASELVSITGAAWLLMGQPLFATTRSLNESLPRSPAPAGQPDAANAARVTIVELRHPITPPRARDGDPGEGQYRRRWWVSGHWRQQVYGPHNSLRRPTFIAPYVKGPDGAPLTTDVVKVLNR